MAEVKSIIVHRIQKSQGSKESILTTRKSLLPLNGKTVEFVETMTKIYRKSSKDYGVFDGNQDTYPFQSMITEYLENKKDFVPFTRRAMNHFKSIIDGAVLATGGYVVFAHYTSKGSEYLLVVMLNDKVSFAIDQNSLDLKDSIHLEMDKIHVSNFINISRWTKKEDTYLSFSKGKKDVSQYFLKFIGCTDRKPAKESSQKLMRAIEDYLDGKELGAEEKNAIKEKVFWYCNERIKDGDQIELEHISRIVDAEAPEAFIELASSEEYGVSSSFDGHPATLNHLRRLSFRNKDLTIAFSRSLLNKTIIFDEENNRLILKDLPEQLRSQFKD